MSYSINISKKVGADITAIAEWYASKDTELKQRFREEIKTKLTQVKNHPEMFQEIDENKRRVLLGASFPYSIYYSIDYEKKKVFIQGVFHQHKKLDRIREEVQLEHLQNIERNKRLKEIKKRRNRSRGLGLER